MGRRQLVRITEPLPMDLLRPAVVGLLAWALGLASVLLLGEAVPGWWTWTAVVGLLIGAAGVLWARRRRDQVLGASGRAASSDPASAAGSSGSGSVSSS